nr:MAG TPA: hypothetical protein [Caudoviricetes sp.]
MRYRFSLSLRLRGTLLLYYILTHHLHSLATGLMEPFNRRDLLLC